MSRLEIPLYFRIRPSGSSAKKKSLRTKDAPDDCGTGAGGFKEDNTCATGSPAGTYRGLVDEVVKERGFTFDPRASKLIRSGYAVSPFKDRELTLNMTELTKNEGWRETIRAKLREYSSSNSDLLRRDKAHLGAWWDDESGNLFLDVSLVVSDLDEATQIAKDNDQLAIYHLDTGETIDVGR